MVLFSLKTLDKYDQAKMVNNATLVHVATENCHDNSLMMELLKK